MALKIVTGGTTGAADGTLVSAGNKLTLTALSPSYISAHIRCDDGYWSNDQAFTIPSNIQISFDGGSTWKGSGDSPYTAPEIEDVNYPIRIRQIASASGDVTLITDGTYTAITALADVSGLSATPGNTQVDLSWSAVTNRTYYQIQRSTDNATWTTLTSTATATTYSDTGLTNGTTYYYRVKAIGTGRYSDSAAWASTNATPTNGFLDSFTRSDSSTVGNSWSEAETSGATVGIASNRLSFGSIAAGSVASIRRTADMPTTSQGLDMSVKVFRPTGGEVVTWFGRFSGTDPETAATGVFGYVEVTTAGVPLLTIFRINGGTLTNMRSGGGGTTGSTIDATAGSVFRLVTNGSSHVLYQDGVAVTALSITDASASAVGCTYGIVRCRGAAGASGATQTLDDVQIIAV